MNEESDLNEESAPPVWTDTEGRPWRLEIDFPTVVRIREECEVNLLEESGLQQLADVLLFVGVMRTAWDPLITERGLERDEFDRLVGKSWRDAMECFNTALADFYRSLGLVALETMLRLALEMAPEHSQRVNQHLDRTTLERLLKKSQRVTERQMALDLRATEAELDAALGAPSGNSPLSPASPTLSSDAD